MVARRVVQTRDERCVVGNRDAPVDQVAPDLRIVQDGGDRTGVAVARCACAGAAFERGPACGLLVVMSARPHRTTSGASGLDDPHRVQDGFGEEHPLVRPKVVGVEPKRRSWCFGRASRPGEPGAGHGGRAEGPAAVLGEHERPAGAVLGLACVWEHGVERPLAVETRCRT